MSSKPELEEYNAILDRVAMSLTQKACTVAGEGKWKLAYVDVRAPVGGGSRISRLRIERMDGTIVKSVSVPLDQAMLFMSIWSKKDKLFDQEWCGVKITVHPDSNHEVEYNYDPDCINDPTFYDID